MSRLAEAISPADRLRIIEERRFETVTEASERTTVSVSQLYDWIAKQEVDCIKFGTRGTRILTDSLNAKLASRIQLPASGIPEHLRGSARVDAIYKACYKESIKHSNAA